MGLDVAAQTNTTFGMRSANGTEINFTWDAAQSPTDGDIMMLAVTRDINAAVFTTGWVQGTWDSDGSHDILSDAKFTIKIGGNSTGSTGTSLVPGSNCEYLGSTADRNDERTAMHIYAFENESTDFSTRKVW